MSLIYNINPCTLDMELQEAIKVVEQGVDIPREYLKGDSLCKRKTPLLKPHYRCYKTFSIFITPAISLFVYGMALSGLPMKVNPLTSRLSYNTPVRSVRCFCHLANWR